MALRVCITWAGVLMSIGGLSESEFRQRINKASGGKIRVTFVGDKGERQRSDSNVVTPHENKQPPWLLSYPPVCLRNLPSLIRQDVLVAGGIGVSGVVVCLLSKLLKKKSMITIHGHYEEEWSMKQHSALENMLFVHHY